MLDPKLADEVLVAWEEAKRELAIYDRAFADFETIRISFEESRAILEAARLRLSEANKKLDGLFEQMKGAK